MDFISILRDFGFPVACVVALGVCAWKMYQAYREDTKEMRTELNNMISEYRRELSEKDSKHLEEMSKFTQALNNNTLAIQQLAARLGGDINE